MPVNWAKPSWCSTDEMGSQSDSAMKNDRPMSLGGKIFFGLCFVVGWATIAFGFWTLFGRKQNAPTYSLELGLGLNIVHDAIFAPVAFVAGFLISRLIPKHFRASITWGLATSVVVMLLGIVQIRDYGKKPDNATIDPLNYTTAVSTVLVVVWLIVAVIVTTTAVRRSRANRPAPDA